MTKNLAQKLSRLISSLDKLRKNKKNPFYNSNYTEINQILAQAKPQSAECGLTILQPIINDQVVTVIMDNDTGEMFPNFNETENMKGLSIKSEKPQDKGSEVTYYRRYGLQSLLAWRQLMMMPTALLSANQITKDLCITKQIMKILTYENSQWTRF